MQQHEENPDFNTADPNRELRKEQFAIEDDSDTLEPLDDEDEHREINADDPEDIAYWASQFQISTDELKAAMVLNGNAVKAVKKYLSV